ncbi:hypothetical protein [Lysobacter arvi]|uniref:Secreted protein n=1 Tax=Lysobacter arvi TaxID=3038776 RepID=A0ABU1CB13_9GAMM|nr:hypothetical protein [Lysobacter arvi]MDR0182333.1 hypothetical protein [Lysobacter arvi]
MGRRRSTTVAAFVLVLVGAWTSAHGANRAVAFQVTAQIAAGCRLHWPPRSDAHTAPHATQPVAVQCAPGIGHLLLAPVPRRATGAIVPSPSLVHVWF